MKVRSNGAASVELGGQRQQARSLDQVDLVEDQELRPATLGELARGSPRRPRRCRARRRQQRDESASLAPPQAVVDHGAVEAPPRREDARRVDEDDLRLAVDGDAAHDRARWSAPCGVTIETLVPTSALISVDLPAFGAPISATKPQRVSLVRRGDGLAHDRRLQTPSRQQRRGGGLLGRALRAPLAPRRLGLGDVDATAKRGAWSGPAVDDRRRSAASARPCAHSCSAVLASRGGRARRRASAPANARARTPAPPR